MITTSDDIMDLLADENVVLFKERFRVDPKHPYAANKKRVTIGSDVWIGGFSFIGDGAIIGSGAVGLERGGNQYQH